MTSVPSARDLVRPSDRRTPIAVAAIVLAAISGFYLHRFYPISDGAMFEFGGRAIARGERLYRDVWDNKLPGVFLVDALWQRLFGERYALHAAAEVGVGLAVAAMTGAVARGFGGPFAWTAALCAVPLLVASQQVNTTEMYALVPLLGAVLCAQRGRGALAGALIGIAAFFWLPSLLVVAALVAITPKRAPWVAAGCALTIVAGGAVFLASYSIGDARQLLDSWLVYASAKRPPDHPKAGVLSPVLTFLNSCFISGVLAGIVYLSGRQLPPERRRTVWTWFAASLAGTFVGTRFYDHYFLPTLPPLAVAIALARPRANLYGRALAPAATAIVTFFLIRHIVDYERYWDDRGAHVRGVGAAVRTALGAGATLSLDDYEPALYLAADARLRTPVEIVARPNATIAARYPVPAPPDLFIATKTTSGTEGRDVEVCAAAAPPWRLQVRPDLAGRFACR